MAIDTSFLKAAKDPVKAAKAAGVAGLAFARTNPRLALGTAAAMALAPKIFENDNRNYFQTASVTTPLLGAAAYAVPGIASAFRTPGRKFASSINEAFSNQKTVNNAAISYEEMVTAQAAYEEGTITSSAYSKIMKRWFSGQKRAPGDLNQQAASLMTDFKNRLRNKPYNMDYISNAIHAEKLRTLDAQGILGYTSSLDPAEIAWRMGRTGVVPSANVAGVSIAPRLSPFQAYREIRRQARSGNSHFVSGMQSRMMQMSDLVDPGGSVLASNKAINRFQGIQWSSASRELQTRFQSEHADVFKAMKAAMDGPNHLHPTDFKLMVLNDGTFGAIKYKNDLRIDLVGKHGEVHMGDQFRRVGVARKVYTADELMNSDVYAMKALGLGFSEKKIQHELARINIVGAVDPSDDFSNFSNPQFGEYETSDGALALRSKQAMPAELYGFGEGGFSDLNAEQSTATTIAARRRFKATKVASESGAFKGILELGETEGLAFFGATSVEKQNPAWRSYTKGVHAGNVPVSNASSWTNIRDSMAPFSATDYVTKQAADFNPHEFSLRVGGVTAEQKTLFGDLPATFSELQGQEQSVIKRLMEKSSLSESQARKYWGKMSEFLSDPTRLSAMRKLGFLGEGGFLTQEGLHGMNVERRVRYDVHEFRAADWEKYKGQAIEDTYGGQTILGFHNGSAVTPRGQKNYIEGVSEMGDGVLGIHVRETVPFATGTKLDAGVKGLVYGVSGDELETIRQGLNLHNDLTGSGGFFPAETTAFQVMHYSQNKTDATESLVNLGSDTLRRLQELDEIHQVSPFLTRLQGVGAEYNPRNGTLLFETAALKGRTSQDLHKEGTQIIQEMLDHVGQRVRAKEMKTDAFMEAFRHQNQVTSWMDYAHTYADPRNARVWNTTQWNVPEKAKVTYDMLQQLELRGQHGVASDLLSRLKVDGDVSMTRDLGHHFEGKKGAITREVDFQAALQDGSLAKLNSAEGRLGTIFSEDAAYDSNYLLKMPDGSKVPVLGHEAYGGKINRYGAGGYSASDSERALHSLIQGHYENQAPAKLAVLKEDYENTLKQFVHGKNSYLRAPNEDPLGMGQFVMTRPSTLRYEDGGVNPFQIGIDPEMISSIKDEKVRAALQNGEEAFAAVTRHPVSHMPMVQVVADPRLKGTNLVGLDEGMRALLMADDDGDMIYSYFMRPQSKGWQEAKQAALSIDDKGKRKASIQEEDVFFQKMLEGAEDDSRLALETAKKPLMERVAKTSFDIDKALLNRSTSGTIGTFSNSLTQMLVGLEANSNITSAAEKSKLSRFFFTSVRQGPISAAKMKSSIGMNKSLALGINSDLKKSLGANGNFESFYKTMGSLAVATDGEENGRFSRYLADNRDLFERYHSGFDREAVSQAMSAVTTPADLAANARKLGMSEEVMPYLHAAATEAMSGEAGTFADHAAGSLGAINQGIKDAAGIAGSAIRKAKMGKILGLGLAAAAIAGIASTSIDPPAAEFGRPSSARYRPEEVAQASPDVGVGSLASNPPRHVYPAQKPVQTAVAASLGETRDLDVQMRAEDQSRAHETAKIISRMSTDGDAHVTVNYKGRMKPGSLRTKDKVRDMLDQ